MSISGHKEDFRRSVTERAVSKYVAAWKRKEETGTEVYRSKEERKETLRKAGGKPGKSEWFQRLGYQNTLTVPASLGGELAKRVKSVLDKSDAPAGFKTLILEDGGKSVKSDLVKSDPFPRSSCNRKTCLMCSNEPSNGQCWTSSVVYSIACNRAPCRRREGERENGEEDNPHVYVGETSRSCKVRGTQHMSNYLKKSDTSFMWRHTCKEHGGRIGGNNGINDYTMKRLSSFNDCLTRIVEEAVEIKELEGNSKTTSLNSRSEYFGAELVRTAFFKGPIDQ